MRNSLLLAMTMIVLFPSLASAQTPPKLGNYQLDWAILHTPFNVEPPSLIAGTGRILVEPPRTPDCPPEAISMVLLAPDGTWCFDSRGVIFMDLPIFGFGGVGFWVNYPNGKAIVQTEPNRGDMLQGVATFISPVKAFITQPRTGATVSGTVWVVVWAEGTTGSANVFTLSADGKQIGSQTTSSHGPVTIPWNTTGVAKGAHTLRADVLDAAGNTGSITLSFVLQ